jgi:hypothetical protein
MDETKQRSYIAEILIGFSLAALITISGLVIWLSKDPEAPKFVFNSVLPLLGTWVGTVLAYYFSRSNFTAAASVYKQMGTPAGWSDTPVTTAMIDKGKIVGIVTMPAGGAAALNVQTDLLDHFKPPVTRIPVINQAGAVQYIIHESTLHKFIVTNPGGAPGGLNVATATLATLLAMPGFQALATAFTTVPTTATLADAKKKMDETPNCEDVFVTSTGTPTGIMLGWITDVTLANHSSVN